jgi:alpha-methylacyl-CoA racemase
LAGLRVLEIAGIGPGPFCAMLLADLGADVLRIDRVRGNALIGPNADPSQELLHRGRRSIAVDLKHAEGPGVVLDLVAEADVLIEGFRPGVAERLGIGPTVCAARNPRLVYGRLTGLGQEGPDAHTVGHDLNYLARSGVLALLGREGAAPAVPLSLIGDFAGGGLLLAMGILAALYERPRSGAGQVIDAAMIDGISLLATPFLGYWQTGAWSPERGTNLVDSGAPFYDVYQTADGKWMSVAAMESKFYANLLDLFGLDPASLPDQADRSGWPKLRLRFAEVVRSRTLAQWCEAARDREVCVAPMLTFDEVADDPQLRARQTHVYRDGVLQPAPAPRFDRTPATLRLPPPVPGEHTEEALEDWGFSLDRIRVLIERGVVTTYPD